jgi:hypothetical protein
MAKRTVRPPRRTDEEARKKIAKDVLAEVMGTKSKSKVDFRDFFGKSDGQAGVAPTVTVPEAGPDVVDAFCDKGRMDRFRGDAPPRHIVVRAYAGTGKTFTQIVGVAYAYGSKALWRKLCDKLGFEPQPSEEQMAVWQAMKRIPAKTIIYCAFNKSIVTEFNMKWGWLVEYLSQEGVSLSFSTINSLGYKCCANAFGRRCQQGKKWKTTDILADIIGRDIREVKRDNPVMVKAVEDLVRYCKLGLVGWSEKALCDQFGTTVEKGFSVHNICNEQLDDLCRHYDVDMEGNRDRVYRYVVEVLQKSYEMTWKLDFDDQNWMPIVMNLPIDKVDLLLVDEAQDLNRCKQEFVLRCGRNLLVVGDTHQAIYGFAGADVESIPRMERLLGVEQHLKLTETRRCGKAIVLEAQKAVPDFRAHESNPPGEIVTISSIKYAEMLQDGDGVLCRINAPLISEALRRLKQKKKAVIIGRKFGEQLASFIKSLKAGDVGDLVQKVDDWYNMEVAKEQRMRNPNEDRLISLGDKRDCVLAFTENCITVEDVVKEIDKVFAGKVCPKCGQHYDEDFDRCVAQSCKTITLPGENWPVGPMLVMPEGVQYSSGHRAKGKEWNNVFFLYPELVPHPMAKTAWAKEQEKNLWYVMVTRAIHRLAYVTK